ncbi:uncharacterized protein LOC121390524 [Gigantopelta aegis]|uniref:uncharacterized protein LOC121390524 n=1 Tax=Gigantopelta aegis TaxID=1735272 RepID=UPI001B88835B|nr:uncharacterized protein LOC121390524 [Gigantopelta aegis]
MLSTVAKKRLTYITFGSYFFMGGIEYAVILPSTWLYVHKTYGAQKYVLGIILAAFSFSGLFAGPLLGRWADRSHRVKLIIMFAACWEIVGSFMYFVGISKWFLVASRLVAGVGIGGESVIIATIARFTTEQERTSVISRLIAIRQTGLLLGPGLNFFLTKADFYIGPFVVNEYTAPGALMAVLWLVLTILIFFMFTELEHIADRYHLEREVTTDYRAILPHDNEPNQYSETPTASSSCVSRLKSSTGVLANSFSTRGLTIDSDTHVLPNSSSSLTKGLPSASNTHILPNSSSSLTKAIPSASNTHVLPNSSSLTKAIPSASSTKILHKSSPTQVLPSASNTLVLPNSSLTEVLPGASNNQVLPNSTSDQVLPNSTSNQVLPTSSLTRALSNSVPSQVSMGTNSQSGKTDISAEIHNSNHGNDFETKGIKCSRALSYSDDQQVAEICNSVEYASLLMESAEKYLTSVSSGRRRSSSDSEIMQIVDDYYSVEKLEYESFPQFDKMDGSVEKSRDTEMRDTGTTVIWRWSFFCNEYIREEIITLLAVQFNTIFAQVCMETMVTPMTDKFLGWGEFENSIMYASAGLEIIIIFILVGWLSKRVEDRKMLLMGTVVMAVANSWLIYCFPRFSPDSPNETLWKFIVGIALDMLSLPFLIVCSVSLYSKLVSKDHQGLGQGIRRSFIGIATILAPLWSGSTFDMPYVMVGVMLALIGLSLVMLLFSFDKLKVPSHLDNSSEHARKCVHAKKSSTDERQPLLA